MNASNKEISGVPSYFSFFRYQKKYRRRMTSMMITMMTTAAMMGRKGLAAGGPVFQLRLTS